VSERERGRWAELRAERIRWMGRSRSMSLIHRSDTAHTRQPWRPDMAALRCTCEQGTNLWGEFWWIEGEHRWVFFDDEKTSQTYAEQLTHCRGCGRSLERKALRATTPSLLP
jgi:hypothetical protein